MTKEEKVRELATEYSTWVVNCKTLDDYYATSYVVMVGKLEKMAQWKDEQIDTIMLTIEGCLRSFFESQGNTQESIDNFIDALKTQINENLNKL